MFIDDNAKFSIDGVEFCERWSSYSGSEFICPKTIQLTNGWHTFHVEFYDTGFGIKLEIRY